MADVVSTRFINFARYGDPNGPATHGPIGTASLAPHWPAFNLKPRPTMIFDTPARIENDPRGPERRYLGQVPYIQPGT